MVGAAFIDVSARQIGLAEFVDNDVFSNAESLVIQLGVKEAVIQEDVNGKDYDLAKVEIMLERCGVITTKIKSCESLLPSSMDDYRGSGGLTTMCLECSQPSSTRRTSSRTSAGFSSASRTRQFVGIRS